MAQCYVTHMFILLGPGKVCSVFIHSFHWHVQNVTIPSRSQELLASSLTSSCHLFLGLPLNLVVTIYINVLYSLSTCNGIRQLHAQVWHNLFTSSGIRRLNIVKIKIVF